MVLYKIMARRAVTDAEKMIKVDHAGENGAVNIYRAQHLVSRIRTPAILPSLLHFLEHEKEHRDIFKARLDAMGVRRCVSYHLCGIGGFTLGFVTGLMGRTAVHATTYAVETVVLEHLEEQLSYLEDADPASFDAVQAIVTDEKEHHDHAEGEIDPDRALTRSLIWIVKVCTDSVIRFGMR